MKLKDIIPSSKPRNFVVKNQKTAGAGAHKDKKRAEKQGDVKHKAKQFAEGVAEGLTTEKQILTRIRQIMYDRKLSGSESNAGELLRLKQQLKDFRSQQSVAEVEVVEDSIRPNLAAALKGIGFKGPFKLGQLPEWMAELQDGRFDEDTSIMIGGDDPKYDPWVAKGYDYGYAYGMESGYQTGLSAQEVLKQAQADTQNNEGVDAGSSDYEQRQKLIKYIAQKKGFDVSDLELARTSELVLMYKKIKEKDTLESHVQELSSDTLASYKKKAGDQASAADRAGDYNKGNKRFKGIMQATNKQFDNDAKKQK